MVSPVEVPAIVVGLGSFGARVVRRIVVERGERGDDDATDAPLATVLAEREVAPEDLATRVLAEARRILGHERIARARDALRDDGLTRLHVHVVAHLGEPGVRDELDGVTAQIERALLEALGPIFEGYRTGAERNLVVLPILAMPHPAGHADGEAIRRAVHGLVRRITETPVDKRATPQVFLIEDVAEFSVLGEHELEQCVRNFLTLLLCSLSAVQNVTELLYGRDAREPLATFVAAVAELPREKLAAYAVDRVAIEVVDDVLEESGDEIDLAEIDAIEEVELAAFDAPRDADRDVLELLNRYGPPVDRDEEPRWWERSEAIRERYGPDPMDPSLDHPQPPPDPPVGWALAKMRAIEESWRLLQRRRFDDVVAKEREDVTQLRDETLARLRKRVDQTLFADPSPAAFRRAARLVERLERGISIRLEDAIRDRDAALPVPPPSFDSFRDAHARFLDTVRRKPDLARALVYGVAFVAAMVVFGPMILRALADALGLGPDDWREPWLRDRAWLTSLLAGAALAGTHLFLVYRKAFLAMRTAFHEMWEALEKTVTSLSDSVLEYFASRLHLARQVARVEALLSLRAAVIADSERLTLVDRAARRARSRMLESLGRLGVVRSDRGEDDLSRMLGARGEALIESLVPPDARRFIDRMLPADARDARVRDVLHSLARDQRYRELWREEVPFTSLDALRGAASSHAREVAEWDPFADPESAEATAQQIAAFARRQARSLHVALNVSGHESHDPSGQIQALAGEVIVPPSAYEEVRRLLDREGAGGRARIPTRRGTEPDRAYYVLTLGDIAETSVASLTMQRRGPMPVPDDYDDRFEVERSAKEK